MTDLARIFRNCLADLGIDEERLLGRIGLRDTAAGKRMLRQLIEDPLQKGPFARKVIAALGPVGERFEVALDLALEAKQPERKAAPPGFQPRLRILTVPPPSLSMGGNMLANVALSFYLPPEWAELPLREGTERVVAFFAAWRHHHPEGCVPGFVWRRRPDEYLEFDERGEFLARYARFPMTTPDVLPGGRILRELSREERQELFARYGVVSCCRRRGRRPEEVDGDPV